MGQDHGILFYTILNKFLCDLYLAKPTAGFKVPPVHVMFAKYQVDRRLRANSSINVRFLIDQKCEFLNTTTIAISGQL